MSLLLCCFPFLFIFDEIYYYPAQRREGFSQNQNLRSLNLFFCVSFFPSHDSLVFVSYETRVIIILRDKRTLKKCVVCSNREWRESSLLVCFFISSFPTSETTKHVEERPKQIHPSTHTSIIIIIVYTHIEEEEDISSSSSWRWYHHHRRRA